MKRRIVFARHQPALAAFVGLASGILVSEHLLIPSTDALRTALILSLILSAASIAVPAAFRLVRIVLLVSTAMVVGFALHQSEEISYHNSTLKKAAEVCTDEVEVRGRVVSSPQHKRHSTLVVVECDTLVVRSEPIVCTDRLAVFIPLQNSEAEQHVPMPGMRVRLFGTLDECTGIRNPYEIPYRLTLRRQQNVSAIMSIRSHFDIRIDSSRVSRSVVEEVMYAAHIARRWIDGRLRTVIHDSIAAGFASAVLIGERSDLGSTTWQDFQKAGLSHIIVVSGFNLAVVTLFFYYLFRVFGVRRRYIRSAFTVIVVIVYAIVAGTEPSIFRAGIAVIIFAASRSIERRFDIVNALAAAASVTLLVNPNDLFNIGFQLSYSAVLSLIIITPKLEHFYKKEQADPNISVTVLKKIGAVFGSYFFTSLAVFLGSLPILLVNFHLVSLIGLLLNIIVIPISSLITVSALLLVVLSFIPALAGIYADLLIVGVQAVISLTNISIGLPFAYIRMPHFGLVFIVCYYSALAYFCLASSAKKLIGRAVLITLIAVDIALLGLPIANGLLDSTDAIVFFDVGQGDAALMKTSVGNAYMIDFGGSASRSLTAADRSIIPFLAAERALRLRGGFVSHIHADHFEGLIPIASERLVDTIYTSGEKSETQSAKQLDDAVRSSRIPVRRLSRGSIIDFGGGAKAYILSPDASDVSNDVGMGVHNHHSLVMKLVTPYGSALFLGDVDAPTERDLVRRYGSFLQSDIVKVAHHGSASSSHQLLIDTVKARYAVISAGRKSRHRHPNADVLRRWYRSGALIASTTTGAVIFTGNKSGFSLLDWK